MKIKNC